VTSHPRLTHPASPPRILMKRSHDREAKLRSLLIRGPPHQAVKAQKTPPLPPRPHLSTPLKPPLSTTHSTTGKYNKHYTPFTHNTFNPGLHILPATNANPSIHTPVHYFDLPAALRDIRRYKQTPLQSNQWSFHRTIDAARHNTAILKSNRFDTKKATQTETNTSLSYGSEFKPVHILQPLLQHHPQCLEFLDIIKHGVTYPLNAITEKDRRADIKALRDRGNHKSAQTEENITALQKSFNKEVRYEWVTPLLPECIEDIPGASITPLGVAIQWSIDAAGNRIVKRRTTHDCTFPGPSGASCNKRVITDLLTECTYGHALQRFLHGIHDMRRRHPNTTIWMNKTDMDAAYRRLHTNMTAAVTCITIIDHLAYLLLRVPFGASPAPSKFSCISDTAADIAHDLAMEPSWDPHSLHSDFDIDSSDPEPLPNHVPFGNADPLLIDLPPRNIVTDNFIDDLFQAGVHIADNAARICHAAPLVLETIFRVSSPRDHAHRDTIINLTKHKAEGKLEERKIVLGWLIDTRRFKLFLAPDKSKEWILDITELISSKKCTVKQLECTIGRLNHTGTIIHIGRYFLTRLRHRLKKHHTKHKHHRFDLLSWDLKDLELWIFFLSHLTHQGVSINNICLTTPSAIVYSDACEWGIGGYTTHGHAWRFLLPKAAQGRASINLLEFLAAIVTIHLSITKDPHSTNHPHILAFTDNSSAAGWLYHSTFDPITNKCHDDAARYLARLLFTHGATLHPEHIPGKDNDIADSLSRDFHLTDTEILTLLTPQLIHTHPQGPHTLQISSIPETLSSWIVSMVVSLTPTKVSRPRPSPSSLALSSSSSPSSTPVESRTNSWTRTLKSNEPLSSPASPTSPAPTAPIRAPPLRPPFKATQSLPPSHMWFRPSGRTFGLTPRMTPPAPNPPSCDAS
jgi:hypothetical protein